MEECTGSNSASDVLSVYNTDNSFMAVSGQLLARSHSSGSKSLSTIKHRCHRMLRFSLRSVGIGTPRGNFTALLGCVLDESSPQFSEEGNKLSGCWRMFAERRDKHFKVITTHGTRLFSGAKYRTDRNPNC